MAAEEGVKYPQPRGYRTHTPSSERLSAVINKTLRIWRTHHLENDQTQYVVARVCRQLVLETPRTRNRRVDQLDLGKVERLIEATSKHHSTYGLMIKVLFQTERVTELLHLRVEDLHLDGNPPQIYTTYAQRRADRFVPSLPALAQDLRTHLQQPMRPP